MKFCNQCGATLGHHIPPGDNRPRWVCNRCAAVHYENPKIVAGCLAVWQQQVLLCRRAIEPRRGYWTLPAGFMEIGETTHQAAIRETAEEACALAQNLSLYALFDLPHISQVQLFFRADLGSAQHAAGDESLETALFFESAIPWSDLAFPTVRRTLQLYFSDRRQQHFPVHQESVSPPAAQYPSSLKE